MSAKAQTVGEQESDEGTSIPEEHRVGRDSPGHYGRPQFKVSYYSQRINAGAIVTFETRHEAVGYVAIGAREGWMERPMVGYRGSYDHRPSKHYK